MEFFIDDEQTLSKLSSMGNPLEGLDKAMDWEQIRPILEQIFRNHQKADSLRMIFFMIFKVLLIQHLHNLSDDAMEYQLFHRLSFRHSTGCDECKVHDAKTIWLYRERLTKSEKEQELSE